MKLLVVIGTVNFHGGAHVATLAMVDALKARGVTVDFMVGSEPNAEIAARMSGSRFFVVPFPKKGFRWFVRGICNRLHLGWFPNWVIDPGRKWRKMAAQYDTIAVIGENSHYRWLIAKTPKGPRKVVFIHTDYTRWRTAWQCNRDDSRCDRWTYRYYDAIAVVGRANAERFADFFPQFSDKTAAFLNLVPEIGSASGRPRAQGEGILQLISLTRIEAPPKKTPRYLQVAKRLKDAGVAFNWTVYGDGELLEPLRVEAKNLAIDDVFHLPGFAPDAKERIRNADLFVLLSCWEGLPNVIYEALRAGTPVFSTDVGAISDQVAHGKTGWLVSDDDDAIVTGLEEVLKDRSRIEKWRQNLVGYSYDNESIVDAHMKLLGLETYGEA